MQSRNPMFADLAKLANGAAGTFAGMAREARENGRERLKEAMGGIDFVDRDEFEAVKAMAAKARAEKRGARGAHRDARGQACRHARR